MPGVHASAIAVGDAVPLQVCGPLTVIFPSAVTLPVKPSNGALNVSEQSLFSVTVTAWPTSEVSQWAVTFHAPETSGHAPLPPSPLVVPPVDDELELHAATTKATTRTPRVRTMPASIRQLWPDPCKGPGVANQLSVRPWMNYPPTTVSPDTLGPEILGTLARRGVSCVPVIDEGGGVLGVVSTSDLVRASVRDLDIPRTTPLRAAEVMRAPALTVDVEDSLAVAAARMVEHRVHRLVVTDHNRIAGILSARDVLRGVQGVPFEGVVGRIMTAPVVTVALGDSIDAAMRRLADARVHGIVVLDGATAVGVFTQAQALAAQKLPPALRARPVEEIVNYEIVTLDSNTPLRRAAAYIVSLHVHRIIVTHSGHVVGVLSALDLLRVLAEAHDA